MVALYPGIRKGRGNVTFNAVTRYAFCLFWHAYEVTQILNPGATRQGDNAQTLDPKKIRTRLLQPGSLEEGGWLAGWLDFLGWACWLARLEDGAVSSHARRLERSVDLGLSSR